ILWRHILPNSAAPVIALAALQLGSAMLQISTLGFLGYGAPPPTPEWGLLISEGRDYVATAWWLTLLPGLVVAAVVLSTNRLSTAIGEREQVGAPSPGPRPRQLPRPRTTPGPSRCWRSATSASPTAPAAGSSRRCAASTSPSLADRSPPWSANPAPASPPPRSRRSACSPTTAPSPAAPSPSRAPTGGASSSSVCPSVPGASCAAPASACSRRTPPAPWTP